MAKKKGLKANQETKVAELPSFVVTDRDYRIALIGMSEDEEQLVDSLVEMTNATEKNTLPINLKKLPEDCFLHGKGRATKRLSSALGEHGMFLQSTKVPHIVAVKVREQEPEGEVEAEEPEVAVTEETDE